MVFTYRAIADGKSLFVMFRYNPPQRYEFPDKVGQGVTQAKMIQRQGELGIVQAEMT
jgi:hypothetical protein